MSQALMGRALELAVLGEGRTRPNPMVGAVVAQGTRIVGEGYHAQLGSPHAEIVALDMAGTAARGADLYVNLEPCCHQGRTPPCATRIIDAGIRRVVVAHRDPNPRVNGRGIATLEAAGVLVEEGLRSMEAARLNEVFFHWITQRKPFVTLKLAMSLDGKIASPVGASRWITGPDSRRLVQRLRRRHAAVLVGVDTVLADDPRLDLRELPGPQPLRVIVDTHARTPPAARVLLAPGRTVIAAGEGAPAERVQALTNAGARVWTLPLSDGRVCLAWLVDALAKEDVDSLLVEGGGEVGWSFLAAGLVQKAVLFYAPLIMGGRLAVPAVGGRGVTRPEDAFRVRELAVERLGDDVVFTGYLGGECG